MRKLMSFVLVALLSLGIASVSLAQGGDMGSNEPGMSATPSHHGKMRSHKKHMKKKGSRAKKKATPSAQ